MSKRIHDWVQMAKSFDKVFYFCISIAAVGFAILLVQYAFPAPACTVDNSSFPATMCFLGNSWKAPWGIVTSMFVHDSFAGHYLPNMFVLFFLFAVLASTNAKISAAKKKSRQLVLMIWMFLSGIAANVVWLWISPRGISYGASGLVYAAWGIACAFCLFNATPRVRRLRDVIPYYSDRSNRSLYNLVVLALLIGLIIFAPAVFLAVGPGVNVIVHGVSFLVAFFGAMVWCFVCDFKFLGPSGTSGQT